MLELHEEIRRARKDLDLSQEQLAALAGIQRRQLSTLERGGNVTLATLRKVVRLLPNLKEFKFEHITFKPEYPELNIDVEALKLHADELTKFVETMQKFLKSWHPEKEAREERKRAREAAEAEAEAAQWDDETAAEE